MLVNKNIHVHILVHSVLMMLTLINIIFINAVEVLFIVSSC